MTAPAKHTAREPFYIEREKRGCTQCGSEDVWNVIYGPTDTAEGTAYMDEEAAEDVASDFNRVFALGLDASAAPELLTALNGALDVLTAIEERGANSVPRLSLMHATSAARAAIAKATGAAS